MIVPESIFLPYQSKWTSDKSQVCVIEKSRRIGISWSEAGEDVLFAATESGDNVWYIGYNKEMALEYINDAAEWSKFFDLAAREVEEFIFKDDKTDKNILAFRINYASGNRITALSSKPSNLRGKQGRIVIDEAAFHADLAGLLKAAIAVTMWGGQVKIISTHDGEENEFNQLINEIRSGKKPYSLHRVTLNDALEQGLYKRICFMLDEEWSEEKQNIWRDELIELYGADSDEELFCIPGVGSGTAFTRELVKQCMSSDYPVIRIAKTKEFTYEDKEVRQSEIEAWCEDNLLGLLSAFDDTSNSYFGMDFGRSGDISVLFPLQELQDTTLIARFVLEMRNIPFDQQQQILWYVINRMPNFCHGALDARGNGEHLAELTAQEFSTQKISQVMLTNNWYLENMPRYKKAYEDKTILIPQDRDIIEDHRAFKMIKGIMKVPERTKETGTKLQRHGDAGIAGALAVFAVNQDVGPAVSVGRDPEQPKRRFKENDLKRSKFRRSPTRRRW